MTAPAGLRTWPVADDPGADRSEAGPRLGLVTCCRSVPGSLVRPPTPVFAARGRILLHADRRRARVRIPTARVAITPRRGRAARLLAAAAVTLVVIGGLGWLNQAPSTGIPSETAVVRVGAGETVWDVARRVAPKSDPRAVVDRIQRLNGMVGSAVQPGQQLQVPDGR